MNDPLIKVVELLSACRRPTTPSSQAHGGTSRSLWQVAGKAPRSFDRSGLTSKATAKAQYAGRAMLLRVVPEEGRDVLPEYSAPWANDIAFEPVSSNRSLRCGETEFSGRRQRGRNGLGNSRRRRRDKISLGNSANTGLIARFREISVTTRMRGGAGRTRTPNQAVMKQLL